MSLSSSTPTEVQRAVRQTVKQHWQLFAVQGTVMTVLGVLAIIWPEVSTVAVDLYVGWLFLISGLVGIFGIFFAPTVSAFLWSLLTSALSLLVGVLLLWHPVEGAASLTLVLVAFFLVEGIFHIALSLSYRGSRSRRRCSTSMLICSQRPAPICPRFQRPGQSLWHWARTSRRRRAVGPPASIISGSKPETGYSSRWSRAKAAVCSKPTDAASPSTTPTACGR
jgi:uncharacterized membrane protein HdeD (DUF308 family)